MEWIEGCKPRFKLAITVHVAFTIFLTFSDMLEGDIGQTGDNDMIQIE